MDNILLLEIWADSSADGCGSCREIKLRTAEQAKGRLSHLMSCVPMSSQFHTAASLPLYLEVGKAQDWAAFFFRAQLWRLRDTIKEDNLLIWALLAFQCRVASFSL